MIETCAAESYLVNAYCREFRFSAGERDLMLSFSKLLSQILNIALDVKSMIDEGMFLPVPLTSSPFRHYWACLLFIQAQAPRSIRTKTHELLIWQS